MREDMRKNTKKIKTVDDLIENISVMLDGVSAVSKTTNVLNDYGRGAYDMASRIQTALIKIQEKASEDASSEEKLEI